MDRTAGPFPTSKEKVTTEGAGRPVGNRTHNTHTHTCDSQVRLNTILVFFFFFFMFFSILPFWCNVIQCCWENLMTWIDLWGGSADSSSIFHNVSDAAVTQNGSKYPENSSLRFVNNTHCNQQFHIFFTTCNKLTNPLLLELLLWELDMCLLNMPFEYKLMSLKTTVYFFIDANVNESITFA